MINSHFDVAVIGGGIMGLSTLYHLSKDTGLRVALFEQNRLGNGSTQKSGGFVRGFHHHRQDILWAHETLTFLRQYQNETGFKAIGCHYLLADVADGELHQSIRLMAKLGEELQLLEAEQLYTAVPQCQRNLVKRAIYEPGAGFADPLRTALFYAQLASDNGALYCEGARVKQINYDGVFRIELDDIGYTADKVSLNLGAWSAEFLAAMGHRSDSHPKAVQADTFICNTAMFPDTCLLDEVTDLYTRPFGNNQQLIGIATNRYDVPLVQELAPDAAQRRACLDKLDKTLNISTSKLLHSGARVGFDSYTADCRGRLYLSASVPGLCISEGWSGAGFKLAHGAGRFAAKLIL